MTRNIFLSIIFTFIASFIGINAQRNLTADIDLKPIEADRTAWTIDNTPSDIAGMELFYTEEENEEDGTTSLVARLTDFASQFLGRRYRLGATGPKTFDCSGFTSYVFKNIGVELNRTSRMQYAQGEKVEEHDIKPGDLMFFSTPKSGKGRVGHVGIVVEVDDKTDKLTFIHASTSRGVTYQEFPDEGYFSRHYIGTKRVLA